MIEILSICGRKNSRAKFRLGLEVLCFCALFSPFAVLAQQQSDPTDQILAIINGQQIKASDISAQIARMPLGEQVSVRSNPEKFTESLIQEEVLFQFALAENFANEPELRDIVKTAAVNHLIEKYVTSKLSVSDDEIAAYYEANLSAIRGETLQVSHILTETRSECESILLRLQQGESFEKLAKKYSIHQNSAINGGLLGSMMNHEGPLGFEQELFEIAENTPVLFDSEDGCHVMVVSDRDTPPLPPIENVAPALEGLIRRGKEIDAVQALIERAHKQVTVIRPE